MFTYIIKRLIQMVPVAIGVTFFVFSILHLIPGDPARIMAGEAAQPDVIEALREQLGLNDPFLVQYFRTLGRIVTGDFGTSIRTGLPVTQEIFESRFFITFQVALIGVSFSSLLGITLGVIQATKKNGIVDMGLMLISLTFMSMPGFWLAILMINLFAVSWQILPVAGWGTLAQTVMPVLVLASGASATTARMTRASLIEVLDQDYIRTAHAKGLPETRIIYRHALRNALIPVITLIGLQFGGLLTGAMITETIFAINGLGRLIVDSIRNQNFPVAQGGILIFSLMFMTVNLIVDVLYRFVNKRIDLT